MDLCPIVLLIAILALSLGWRELADLQESPVAHHWHHYQAQRGIVPRTDWN